MPIRLKKNSKNGVVNKINDEKEYVSIIKNDKANFSLYIKFKKAKNIKGIIATAI